MKKMSGIAISDKANSKIINGWLYGVGGIYSIKCVANNKVYIGESSDIAMRLGDHIKKLNNAIHPKLKLNEDYKEHGGDLFVFTVEDIIEDERERFKTEQYMIKSCILAGLSYNTIKIAEPKIQKQKRQAGKNPQDIIRLKSLGFLTQREVAEEFKVTRQTIAHWQNSRKLPEPVVAGDIFVWKLKDIQKAKKIMGGKNEF